MCIKLNKYCKIYTKNYILLTENMAASDPGVMLLFYLLFNEEFFPSFTTFDVFSTALGALVARSSFGQ